MSAVGWRAGAAIVVTIVAAVLVGSVTVPTRSFPWFCLPTGQILAITSKNRCRPEQLRRREALAGAAYYSVNPWYSTEMAAKYRAGLHFAWVSDYFDTEREAPAGSSGHMIAPSSNPRKIYEDLLHEYRAQEEHARVIRDHRKTFRRLAKQWFADGSLTKFQHDEIIASVNAASWRIWKPVLYVIPKTSIDPRRVVEVRRRDRAGYGPERQIVDLRSDEFDILDLSTLVPPL